MKTFLFVAGDFLRANLPELGHVFLWAASLSLVLLGATALWIFPAHQPAGPPSSLRLLLVQLSPLLSEREINELAWQIWSWPEVKNVSFRFPKEKDPEEFPERGLVVELRGGAEEQALLRKLGGSSGVINVTVWERTIVPPRVPSAARIGALVALLSGLGLSLFLGPRTLRRAQNRWKREQEILYRSGASPILWRGPLLLLAVLAALFGAALHSAVLAVGVHIVPPDTPWAELIPGAIRAMVSGFPAALLLALVGFFLSPHS